MANLQSQADLRRKLRTAERKARLSRRVADAALPAAWFLTDPERTPDPVSVVERLPRGWGVIFRGFGRAGSTAEAVRLARACRRRGLVFLIAADPGLARAVRADGVHWPEARLPRRTRRRTRWITSSAHSMRALERAARAGCDAALLSPVFPSRSPSAGAAMGPRAYRALAQRSPLPLIALAGVEAGNAAQVSASHAPLAAGWAAIEGILEAFGKS